METETIQSEIQLHFLKIEEKDLRKFILLEVRDPEGARALKIKALEMLGVQVLEGETPLQAWCRHLHEINGLQPQYPVAEAIKEAILSDPEAVRFMYILA